jgi:hypothetical protein
MADWRIQQPSAASKKAKSSASGLPPPPPKQEGKGRARGEGKGRSKTKNPDKLRELMTTLIKSGLATQQQVRALTATAWTTYLVPSMHPIIPAAEAAGKAYFEAVRGQPQHTKGPPHIHIFAAVVQAAAEQEDGDAELKMALEEIVKVPPAEVAELVLHFQVKKCHPNGRHADKHKVTMAFSPMAPIRVLGTSPGGPKLHEIIRAYMVNKVKAAMMQGQPPRSQLERALQRLLQDVETAAAEDDDDDDP